VKCTVQQQCGVHLTKYVFLILQNDAVLIRETT